MKISGHDHRATINDAISKSAFIERWPPPEGYCYGDLAAYYQTAVLPARPRKPCDKAKVEQVGLIVERWLLILDSSKTL